MLEVRHISFDDNDLISNKYYPAIYGSSIFPIEYSDIKNNYKVANYISFDALGIDLEDNNKKFYNGEFTGFISSGTSNEDCENVIVELYFEIGDTFPEGITLCFYGHCCKELWIQYSYDASELYSYSFDVTNSTAYIPIEPFGIRLGEEVKAHSVRIVIHKTALPNQLLKLQSVIIGKVNTLNKFKNGSLLEEVNVLSDDLPINSFECEVVAEDIFSENEPINVYSNSRYYGTFYLDNVERISKNVWSIKALNSVSKLEKIKYYKWSELQNFLIDKELEEYSKSGIINKLSQETGVKIESDIDLSPYSVFGCIIENARFVLCAIAFVCRLMVDSSRSADINLIDIPRTITSIINNKRIIGDATFKRSSLITEATWQYPIEANFTETTISAGNKANEKTKLVFEQPTAIGYDFATPIDVNDESYGVFEFSSPNENITLSKREYTFSKNEVVLKNNSVPRNQKSNIVNYNNFELCGEMESESDGEVYTLIDKSTDIKKYIQSSGSVHAKIRLRNEKVGDLVQIETAYDGVKTGIITSMNIHFGYEDTADIEVLEWQIG